MQSTVLGPQNVDDVETFINEKEKVIEGKDYEYPPQLRWLEEYFLFNENRIQIFKKIIEVDCSLRDYEQKVQEKIRNRIVLTNEKLQECAVLLHNPDYQKMAQPNFFYTLRLDEQIESYKWLYDFNDYFDSEDQIDSLNSLATTAGSIILEIIYLSKRTTITELDTANLLKGFEILSGNIDDVKTVIDNYKSVQDRLKEQSKKMGKPINTEPIICDVIDPNAKINEFNEHENDAFIYSSDVKNAFKTFWLKNNLVGTKVHEINSILDSTYNALSYGSDDEDEYDEDDEDRNYLMVCLSFDGVKYMLGQISLPLKNLNEKIYADVLKAMENLKEKTPKNAIKTMNLPQFSFGNGMENCVKLLDEVRKLIEDMTTIVSTSVNENHRRRIDDHHFTTFENDLKTVVTKLTTVLSIVNEKTQSKLNTTHS